MENRVVEKPFYARPSLSISPMSAKKNKSHACAYFFFDGRDSQKALQLHESLIRSLIQQFSDQCDHIPDDLLKLYGNGHRQSSTTSLEDTLQHIIGGFTDIYIVIDSLDECSERRNLLTWIRKFPLWKSGKRHLLVTSRPEPDITDELQSLESVQISMEEEPVDGDIRLYIDSRIQYSSLRRWSEAVKMHIKEMLMQGAQGMFRWVALQLEELEKCPSQYKLKKQLEDLPKDLNETYDRILLNIDDHHRDDAKLFLQWAAFAARPLALKELAEAVAFDSDLDTGPRYNPDRVYATREDVLTACSSLLITSNEQVKLAHFSVKEYLVSELIRSGVTSYFSVNEDATHSLISQTCLVHLLRLDQPDAINGDTVSNFPLAKYAAENWAFHVRSRGTSGVPAVQELIMKLLQTESPPLTNWIRLWDPDGPVKRPLEEIPSPLYYASLLRLEETVRQLLHRGADVNIPGGEYGNPLQAASFVGCDGIVKLLLQNNAHVNVQGGYFGNALQAAVCGGYEEIVSLLLQAGADVNIQGGQYATALLAACAEGRMETVQLLLENGADVNAQRRGDTTGYGDALQAAAAEGHDAVAQLLLQNGANVNGQGKLFGRALLWASFGGHKATVLSLLRNGADVNAKDTDPQWIGNALQAASAAGHEQIVGLLLEHGADVNARGGYYDTALLAASTEGHDAISNLLLQNGADANVRGGLYDTALLAASTEGHMATVQLLLENGADVNAQREDTTGYGDALQAAAAEGHDVVAQLLLQNGANVNGQGKFFGRALLCASFGGREATVLSLLRNGADVNATDTDPQWIGNALQAASAAGQEQVVKLLLEHGADVNAQGGFYDTTLLAACFEGHMATVQLLLENGADVNAQRGDTTGYGDALQAAAAKGHDAIVQLLLQSGAAVNAQGGCFGHALQGASYKGYESIAKLLLENGANVDAPGDEYGYALQAASFQGREGVVRLLLEHGANVDAQGGYFGNALQAASSEGYRAIAMLLLEKGADVNAQGGLFGNSLLAASINGHDAIVTLLLENQANVNALGRDLGSMIEKKFREDDGEAFEPFLERLADVDVKGEYGHALQAASHKGHQEIARILLEHGADVNALGGDYGSALRAALDNGHDGIVKLLLEHGATQPPVPLDSQKSPL